MKLLEEPLIHFLALGALLFVVYDMARDDSDEPDVKKIVVSAGRIEQLTRIFQKTWQRPQTEQELQELVDDYVLEEIYYRQAVAMGIDREDTVIRRRMRQKFEFLTQDLTTPVPAAGDLERYLAENPGKFQGDVRYTCQQVYVDPDRHGDALGQYLEEQLAALRAGGEPAAGSGLIPPAFDEEPARTLDAILGKGFAQRLDALPLGEWQGPVPSGLGLHLVRLTAREAPPPPELENVKTAVEREWAYEQQERAKAEMEAALRGRYQVVIEWPQEQP